jgi:hypothetical protein
LTVALGYHQIKTLQLLTTAAPFHFTFRQKFQIISSHLFLHFILHHGITDSELVNHRITLFSRRRSHHRPESRGLVIKPDPIDGTPLPALPSPAPPQSVIARPLGKTQTKTINTQMTQTLISSIFATISSFEASYFQLQAAHVPFVEESVKEADRALVSHLQRLSEFKQFYYSIQFQKIGHNFFFFFLIYNPDRIPGHPDTRDTRVQARVFKS